jgi:hypothetical protein
MILSMRYTVPLSLHSFLLLQLSAYSDDDYWLVFRDEGVSLQQLLYAVTKSTADDSSSSSGGSGGEEDRRSGRHGTSRSAPAQYSVLEPSAIWMKLRTAAEGGQSVKSIMFKIISGE